MRVRGSPMSPCIVSTSGVSLPSSTKETPTGTRPHLLLGKNSTLIGALKCHSWVTVIFLIEGKTVLFLIEGNSVLLLIAGNTVLFFIEGKSNSQYTPGR